MEKRFLIAVVYICLISNLFVSKGQNANIIRGKIIDADRHQPLSFANVYTSSGKFATITNLEGDFELKVDVSSINDTLHVSFIGFIPFLTPVNQIIGDSLTIILQTDVYQIQEITITPDYVVSVLKKVIAKMPENTTNDHLKLQTFYREIIEENGQQVQYAEAVFDIYKNYKGKNHSERIDLVKGRIKKQNKVSDLWSFIDFVDGPFELAKSDIYTHKDRFLIVPQNKINFLNEKHFKFYNYSLHTYLHEENSEWIIEFTPNLKYRRAVFSGQIYIDPESYAIKTLVYEVNSERVTSVSLIPVETQMFLDNIGVENHSLDYYCMVSYKQCNGKWILNSAKIDYRIIFNSRRLNLFSLIHNISELVVMQSEITEMKKIRYKNALQLRRSLTDQINETDSIFWEEYNIIKDEKGDF